MTPNEIEALILEQARAYQNASLTYGVEAEEKRVLREIGADGTVHMKRPADYSPAKTGAAFLEMGVKMINEHHHNAYATKAILSYYKRPLIIDDWD